jgi:DNA-binding NarL/FixJ family response regulator
MVSTVQSEVFSRDATHPGGARSRMRDPRLATGSSGTREDDGHPSAGSRQRVMDDPETAPCDGEQGPGSELAARIRVVVGVSFGLLADAIGALLETAPDLELVGTMTLEDPMLGIDPTVAPDVVLVECLFRSEPCPVLLQRVRGLFPSARALVVCREPDDQSLAELVAAGALGRLTPDCRRDELVSAIRRVSQGEILFPAALLMRLLMRQREPSKGRADATSQQEDWIGSVRQPTAERTSAMDPPVFLARRERQVLETVATGRSTEEVATALDITVHTVRTHLKNAMVKLNTHSKLEAVVVALRRGLIELPD